MHYWNQVLTEVLNKQDPHQTTVFTSVKDYMRPQIISPNSMSIFKIAPIPAKPNTRSKKYYLGQPFPNIFFTQREAQVAFYFTRGLSANQVADLLLLSRRTVEFYVNNMRCKLDCHSKSELVEKIMQSEFLISTDCSQW